MIVYFFLILFIDFNEILGVLVRLDGFDHGNIVLTCNIFTAVSFILNKLNVY